MKILLGTNNKAKIEGAKKAFENYYSDVEIIPQSVNSGVSDQPVNEDIYIGALNRVNALIEHSIANKLEVDFYAAIESGIAKIFDKWVIINVAIIKDRELHESYGFSEAFPVPQRLVKEITETDLGKVIDKMFNLKNIGRGRGGVSLLTKDVITRADLTSGAFIMALTKFINQNWKD